MLNVHWWTIVIDLFKNWHYLWTKYRLKLSPSNEDDAELFFFIVPQYGKMVVIGRTYTVSSAYRRGGPRGLEVRAGDSLRVISVDHSAGQALCLHIESKETGYIPTAYLVEGKWVGVWE